MVHVAVIALCTLGTITAYYVVLPLFLACGHCAILVLWRPPKDILLDLKRQLSRRQLSDVLLYLVIGMLVATMVVWNLPEKPADYEYARQNTGDHNSGHTSDHTWSHDPDKEYYDLLGLPPGSSWEEIQKAYHKLSLEWHPDKHPPSKHIYVKTVSVRHTTILRLAGKRRVDC